MTDMVKAVEEALMMNNFERLPAEARVAYLHQLCESMGLNPLSHPFEFIKLNGRWTLYAKKGCTDQLRAVNGVNIEIVENTIHDHQVYVHVRATVPDDRFPTGVRSDEDIGVVFIGSGAEALNNRMKAVTKAKRRVTLSICGLGFIDETELETVKSEVPARAEELLGKPKPALPPSQNVQETANELLAPYVTVPAKTREQVDAEMADLDRAIAKRIEDAVKPKDDAAVAVVTGEQLRNSPSTEAVVAEVKKQLKQQPKQEDKPKRGRRSNAVRMAEAVGVFEKLGINEAQIQAYLDLADLTKANSKDIDKLLEAHAEVRDGANPDDIFDSGHPTEIPPLPTGDIKEMF
tara:strand:+ start:4963 stop:6006 length:1044 start_codon:yes stop_codon:yes gene_type:complete